MLNSIQNLFSKTNVDPEKEQLKITLNIYDILQPGFLTNVGYVLGIGVYHTGIEIGKKEYCFGGHNLENHTGVFVVKPKIGPHDVPYKQSIQMGYSKLNQEELKKLIEELSNDYMGTTYNLLTRNCNHFSEELCKKLTGKPLPGWINRAAKLGAMFPCVIPTDWVDPPDAQAVTAGEIKEGSKKITDDKQASSSMQLIEIPEIKNNEMSHLVSATHTSTK